MNAPVVQALTPEEAEEARHVAFDRFMSAPKSNRRSAHARYQTEMAEIARLERRA